MNWELVLILIAGVAFLLVICFISAIVEGEIDKRKEAKKWKEWADQRREEK